MSKKIKLTPAQNEALKQIYEISNAAMMDKVTNITACDLYNVSLNTLGSLLAKGLVREKRMSGAMTFPRNCIAWYLTDEGHQYYEEHIKL